MSNKPHQSINKETCEHCSKYINVGQCTAICDKCNIILHGKCSSKNFSYIRSNWYCDSCVNMYDINHYNPFFEILQNMKHEKIYESESHDFVELHENVSNVLEDCKNFSRYELNHYLNFNEINRRNIFSSYFLNIDGNNTNFDNFVTELQLIDTKFSVIGLAETNTDALNKDNFQINNYTPCYQKTIPNKNKGTLVALYVHNTHNFSVLNEFSISNKDIETLYLLILQMHQNL